MLLEKITIKNLFSYCGEQTIDLDSPKGNRNIILISGRNEYGKTNFIRSMKLLFGGVNDAILGSVLIGKKLSQKQYILGWGDNWLGIMNRKAYRNGERECGIEVQWHEDTEKVIVSRFWLLENDKFTSRLQLKTSYSDQILEEQDAQDFLEKKLPQDYIPFFFFDGEEIHKLAEASRTDQLQQIERLLDISRIDSLQEYIKKVENNWKKDAMVEDAKLKLQRLENEEKEELGKKAKMIQDCKEIDDELVEIQFKIEENERYFNSMRAINLKTNENELKNKKESIREEIKKLSDEIAQQFPVDAPLTANPLLVKKAVEELRKITENETAPQIDLLESLIEGLPADLFDKPPYPNPTISEYHKNFYKKRLEQRLSAYIPLPEHIAESFISVDINRAKVLFDKLNGYTFQDKLRLDMSQKLRLISRKKNELNDVEQKLEDVSSLSSDEIQEYQRRRKESNDFIDKSGRYKSDKDKLEKDIKSIDKKTQDIQGKIIEQQEQIEKSEKVRKKFDLAKKVRRFFSDYKERLKASHRQDIEEAINKHLKELMTSHHLIVRVSEDFGLRYEDRERNPIGMGNVSSGIKQLIATALLWALKEVSGKTVPLIIDTPLARIDRKHQENLLCRYYPHVGKQVIILPTDSELDKEKYTLLQPYIYREYCLENPDREGTKIEEKSMYQRE